MFCSNIWFQFVFFLVPILYVLPWPRRVFTQLLNKNASQGLLGALNGKINSMLNGLLE